jgi:hypothetical protein
MITSVWERALGDRMSQLSPELQLYFSLPPLGAEGHGEGVYDEAGSRRRWLWPVLAFLGWRQILFSEYGTEVPFSVTNSPTPEGTLRARRTFSFAKRERVLVDELRIVNGELHDFLGARGGLEASLTVSVDDGMLRLTSNRLWLHLGALRVPLPQLARIHLVEQSVDTGQRVDVRIVSPVIGEWFVYRGNFTYSVS